MLLSDLAATWREVAASSSRRRKVELLGDVLRRAEPAEVPVVVAYLSGELRQRRTGLGWAALRDLPPPAAEPSLRVLEVDDALARVADLTGPGSQRERRTAVERLFARATAEEQRYLAGLVGGELRQGALAALVVEAVARAGDVDAASVRRAVMLAGATAPVAAAVLRDGPGGLAAFRLQVGRPLLPMLASPVDGVTAALERLGRAVVEEKLDGVRIQVHRDGDDVAVFTRTLDDVTARLPEVVEAVRALPLRSVVLDGEVVGLRPDGRSRPFQETAARLASRLDVARARAEVPLALSAFDVLHLDGADLLGERGAVRDAALGAAVPEELRVRRRVTDDPEEAAGFLDEALARGHEGVVVKSLEVPYEAGRRGTGWLKVKPVHTLDLVVLAAEWGSGRRRGWMSNLHLGARDPQGGFVMLGKTFKGLTDAVLAWQTEALRALATGPADPDGPWVVEVRPEMVVEVAFDGVQASPRYPAGMALRFARVVRHRPDKRAAQADTVADVRLVFDRGRGTAGS